MIFAKRIPEQNEREKVIRSYVILKKKFEPKFILKSAK